MQQRTLHYSHLVDHVLVQCLQHSVSPLTSEACDVVGSVDTAELVPEESVAVGVAYLFMNSPIEYVEAVVPYLFIKLLEVAWC